MRRRGRGSFAWGHVRPTGPVNCLVYRWATRGSAPRPPDAVSALEAPEPLGPVRVDARRVRLTVERRAIGVERETALPHSTIAPAFIGAANVLARLPPADVALEEQVCDLGVPLGGLLRRRMREV